MVSTPLHLRGGIPRRDNCSVSSGSISYALSEGQIEGVMFARISLGRT
jgi:hypothetical protein